jgi:hypothetical protein
MSHVLSRLHSRVLSKSPRSTVAYVDSGVFVAGVPVQMIIDTPGCSKTTLSSTFARLTGLPIDTSKAEWAWSAEGHLYRTSGGIRQAPLLIGNAEHSVDVSLSEASNYSVLLGTDWLVQAEAVINFGSSCLHVRSKAGGYVSVPIRFNEVCQEKKARGDALTSDPEEEVFDPESGLSSSSDGELLDILVGLSDEEDEKPNCISVGASLMPVLNFDLKCEPDSKSEEERQVVEESVLILPMKSELDSPSKAKSDPVLIDPFSCFEKGDWSSHLCMLNQSDLETIVPLRVGHIKLKSSSNVSIPPFSQKLVTTGVHFYIPVNHVATVTALPKLAHSAGLITATSIVDGGFRSEIRVLVANITSEHRHVREGTFLAVFEAMPIKHIISASGVADLHDLGLPDEEFDSRVSGAALFSEHVEPTEVLPPSDSPQTTPAYKIGDLEPKQKVQLQALLERFSDLFISDFENLTVTPLVEHCIDTGDAKPVRQAPYRESMSERELIRAELQRMLDARVIIPSQSPWASPVVMVEKPDGSTRFCVDLRRLNALTVGDSYPLPRIDETLENLAGAEFFSTLDCASGFWQIPIREEDKAKTAFVCRQGLFQFERMCFGLCNATSTFQRLLDHVIGNLKWECCLIYVDDLNVYSKTFEAHLVHLEQVFLRVRAANLKLKAKKCSFA